MSPETFWIWDANELVSSKLAQITLLIKFATQEDALPTALSDDSLEKARKACVDELKLWLNWISWSADESHKDVENRHTYYPVCVEIFLPKKTHFLCEVLLSD